MNKTPITISQLQQAFTQLPKTPEASYHTVGIPFSTLKGGESTTTIDWPTPVIRLKLLFEWRSDLNKWVLDSQGLEIISDDVTPD